MPSAVTALSSEFLMKFVSASSLRTRTSMSVPGATFVVPVMDWFSAFSTSTSSSSFRSKLISASSKPIVELTVS